MLILWLRFNNILALLSKSFITYVLVVIVNQKYIAIFVIIKDIKNFYNTSSLDYKDKACFQLEAASLVG